MTDAPRLAALVDAWREGADRVVALLRSLGPVDWDRPTDLPGWDVRAVAAHLAHLESELAGFAQEPVEVGEVAHARSPMGLYTERGPLARAAWTPEEVVGELERAVAARAAELAADPPRDASAPAPRTPGGIGWDTGTLLSNRVVDVWVHEQDVRRAVGRPGGLDGAAAAHVGDVFARSLAYVVGKRVAPPAGTTVVLEVTGAHPRTVAVRVGDDGRAAPVRAPDDPTVALTLDFEDWTVLAAGRRAPASVPAGVAGDEALGRAVLDRLAVTP